MSTFCAVCADGVPLRLMCGDAALLACVALSTVQEDVSSGLLLPSLYNRSVVVRVVRDVSVEYARAGVAAHVLAFVMFVFHSYGQLCEACARGGEA